MPFILIAVAVMLLAGWTPLSPWVEDQLAAGHVWARFVEPVGFLLAFHWMIREVMERWGEGEDEKLWPR